MNWRVPAMWDRGSCWIIGGGLSMPRQFGVPDEIISDVCTGVKFPNAYSPFLEVLHKFHIIGINNSYLIGNWIDVLFFGDCSWYLTHRRNISLWPGLKVTCCPRFANVKKKNMEGIKFLQKDQPRNKGISDNPHRVSWNGNSGSAAISLASHFGVKKIFLLGFDMRAEKKYTHWHGSHQGKGRSKKMPYERHLRGFPMIAEDAKRKGLSIFNVSSGSVIEEFPKITLEEALDESSAT